VDRLDRLTNEQRALQANTFVEMRDRGNAGRDPKRLLIEHMGRRWPTTSLGNASGAPAPPGRIDRHSRSPRLTLPTLVGHTNFLPVFPISSPISSTRWAADPELHG
jgi:hypothetical protein